jgi:GNAT superfamily N-acetyltransferase
VDIREEAGGDLVAAALWLPITGPPLPPPRDYDARLAAVCGPWLDRFRVFDETLESHHPRASHHHLAFLAVTPTLQGRGLGGRLIAEHHALLDRLGMPAYLEAGDPRSRDLYLRHGYQPLDPFRLPQGPPFFPMWRSPATSRPVT